MRALISRLHWMCSLAEGYIVSDVEDTESKGGNPTVIDTMYKVLTTLSHPPPPPPSPAISTLYSLKCDP